MSESRVRVFPAIMIAPLLAPVAAWAMYSLWIGGLWVTTGETDPYVSDLSSALLSLLVFFLYGGPTAYLGTTMFVVPGILAFEYYHRLEFSPVILLSTLAGALSSMVFWAAMRWDLPGSWTNSLFGAPSAWFVGWPAGISSGGWPPGVTKIVEYQRQVNQSGSVRPRPCSG